MQKKFIEEKLQNKENCSVQFYAKSCRTKEIAQKDELKNAQDRTC